MEHFDDSTVMENEKPHIKLHPLQMGSCRWTSGFWAQRFQLCKDTMVPYMGDLLCGEIGHALNNFKIAAGLKEGQHQGMFWHDGDFYKWLEAGICVHAHHANSALLVRINECIEIIAQAQENDGYLQTQIQLRDDVGRYENRKYHEMYNTGHLLLTACLHHQVTGSRRFLDIAVKHADLLYEVFYPEIKQFSRFGFNQTQIMGLVALYRATKNQKYLRLAQRFIDRRGQFPVIHDATTEGYPIGDMVQERVALREATEAAGHAVLALYYYAGAAEVYAETGEKALIEALDRMWESVTQKKMYVTGAVGQTHYGASSNRDKIEEGFIDDYMMPNLTAYNETCANLCNAIFNQKMLSIHGQSKYADIVELVMFNSALSGIGLDGKSYFYANPLRMIHGARSYHDHDNATETPNREPYLECFCCPPNLVRTIAKLSSWAYAKSTEGIAVNLFGGSILETKLLDGSDIKLTQTSNYPWDGTVTLTIEACKKTPFTISLRIPDWVEEFEIFINGQLIETGASIGTYAHLSRSWLPGDQVHLELAMPVQIIEGHPRIEEVRNQVAIRRGPLIYCIESPDLPAQTKIWDVYLPADQEFAVEHRPNFLGGISVIRGHVFLRQDHHQGMYQQVKKPNWKSVETIFVPYFAWSNRGNAEMTVFMPSIWNKP